MSEKLKQRFFKPVSASVLSAGVNDLFYEPQTTAINWVILDARVEVCSKRVGKERLMSIIESSK